MSLPLCIVPPAPRRWVTVSGAPIPAGPAGTRSVRAAKFGGEQGVRDGLEGDGAEPAVDGGAADGGGGAGGRGIGAAVGHGGGGGPRQGASARGGRGRRTGRGGPAGGG